MTPKLKKIILILVLAIVAFVVYAVFIKKDPVSENTLTTGGVSPEAQAIGGQISQALLRIEQIKLDKSIFNNDIYKSLVDRSRPISEEPIGRSNPFAPIGSVSINSTTRTATTSTATTTKPQVTPGSTTQTPTNPPASAAN